MRTVLREHSSCFAIALTLSPLRAMTRISTACSWVNIRSPEMAAILPQVGHFYFGAVGQYYFGVNTCGSIPHSMVSPRNSTRMWPNHSIEPTPNGAAHVKR